MVVYPVRRPNNSLFILSGRGCSDYLATAAHIAEVNYSDTFNGRIHVDPGKTLLFPLDDNSPHIDHCTEASRG
jgi:hypothetical protein